MPEKHPGTSTVSMHGQLLDRDCSYLANPCNPTMSPCMEGEDSGTYHSDKLMGKEVV